MTVKEFRKLCEEHNAMDYVMVIDGGNRKTGYPFTIDRLVASCIYDEIRARFDSQDEKEYKTTDCTTVEKFLNWAYFFDAYNMMLEDYSYKYNHSRSTVSIDNSHIRFVQKK